MWVTYGVDRDGLIRVCGCYHERTDRALKLMHGPIGRSLAKLLVDRARLIVRV